MKKWYREMTKGQKILVYVVSTGLILMYGLGLAMLAVLIYLQLGQTGSEA